jgi:hypothetical protein
VYRQSGHRPWYAYGAPPRVVPVPVYVEPRHRHHHGGHHRHDAYRGHGGHHDRHVAPPAVAPPRVVDPPRRPRDVNGRPQAVGSNRSAEPLPGRLDRRPSYGGRRHPDRVVAEAESHASEPFERGKVRATDRGRPR